MTKPPKAVGRDAAETELSANVNLHCKAGGPEITQRRVAALYRLSILQF